jgi:Sugar kinases, ribokinase family
LYKVVDAVDWLKSDFGIHKIILTEGAKGATLFWEGEIITCEVKKLKNIQDTVGAGDSFTSLFLHGIIHHLPLEMAMQRAADFAGVICQTSGAVPVDLMVYEKYKF